MENWDDLEDENRLLPKHMDDFTHIMREVQRDIEELQQYERRCRERAQVERLARKADREWMEAMKADPRANPELWFVWTMFRRQLLWLPKTRRTEAQYWLARALRQADLPIPTSWRDLKGAYDLANWRVWAYSEVNIQWLTDDAAVSWPQRRIVCVRASTLERWYRVCAAKNLPGEDVVRALWWTRQPAHEPLEAADR